jgi:hypothetical protein
MGRKQLRTPSAETLVGRWRNLLPPGRSRSSLPSGAAGRLSTSTGTAHRLLRLHQQERLVIYRPNSYRKVMSAQVVKRASSGIPSRSSILRRCGHRRAPSSPAQQAHRRLGSPNACIAVDVHNGKVTRPYCRLGFGTPRQIGHLHMHEICPGRAVDRDCRSAAPSRGLAARPSAPTRPVTLVRPHSPPRPQVPCAPSALRRILSRSLRCRSPRGQLFSSRKGPYIL